ncbi:uncharacterized protein [Palaemon carinicauda]|uniref:uncharacterized protein n=1 Tax=Palaemon carinicauda TaxID=392227 RepID=UPI0035B5BCFD
MSQNVNRSDSEVVYLVPCKEKHTASQIICAGKSQLDLIKIHLSYVGSPNLPVVTSGNGSATKKLGSQGHCSLVKNRWNSQPRKKNQRCLPNDKSQTSLPAPAPPVSTDSPFKTRAYDAGPRANVADVCDPLSLIQSSGEVKNNGGQNDALNVDEFCNLLLDISEQGIISEDRDNFQLSNKEMSCKVPFSTAHNPRDSLETVFANGGSEVSFPACDNPSSDFYSDKDIVPSLRQADSCGGTSYAQPHMERQLLSNELVWTRQAPRPTVMPVTSSSNMMWTCDQENIVEDLLGSFEDTQSISNSGQAASCSYPQVKGSLYDQEKFHDSGMTFNTSNSQNIVSESNVPVAEILDTCKDEKFQNSLDYTMPDIKFSEASKESIKSNEVSNINDIISDVADILDEIHTTNDTKLTVPKENFFLDPVPSNSSVPGRMSSCSSSVDEKSQLDDFMTSLDGTADFTLDTFFQTPGSIQKANENADSKSTGGYLSNESGNNTYYEDSSEKSESALIFSELITSPEEYQNNSVKSSNVSESKICDTANTREIAQATITSTSLQAKNIQPNCSSADSSGIPKRVAFKVRPAGKPSRSFDKGRSSEKISRSIPKLFQPTSGKDRPTKVDFRSRKLVEACTEQLIGNGPKKNPFSPEYTPFKYFSTPHEEPRVERASSTRDSIKHKQNNVILPIGKTGMSIAIPNTVKTDMVSFIPAGEKVCESSTKILPGNTSGDQLNARRDSLSSRPKKSVFQYIKPSLQNADYIATSSANPKSIGTLNQVIQQTILETTDVLVSVPSSTVTFSSGGQLVTPYSQNSNCKPIYVVLPSTSNSINNGVNHYSLPIASITSQAGKPKTNSISTLQIVQVDGRDTILKQSLVKPVWSITAAGSCVSTSVSKKASDKISEPIRITVRTRPRTIAPNQGGSDDRLKMKCAHSSIPRAVKNRNLVKELKIHFPTVSEAILQQLTIPPQAVNRGFLTRHDLQNLHNQALKLHLSIVYRNHVTKCTNYDCETCRNFVGQQDSLKWSLKEQQNKSKNGGKNNKGKKGPVKPKKAVKKCIRTKNTNGEEDDPTYEPPVSYFKAWKRKIDTNWCRQPMKILKVSGHIGSDHVNDTEKHNICFRNIQPTGNATEKCMNSLKRSLSEPAITSVRQNPDDTSKHTQDDMNIKYSESHPKLQYTVTLPTVDANGNRVFMENFSEKVNDNIHQVPAVSSESSVMYQPPLVEERKDLGMDCKVEQWPSVYNDQNYAFPCGINQNYNTANLQPTIMNYPYAAESAESQCYGLDTNMALMPPQPMPLNSECQYSPALYLEKGCNCSESCRTMKCPCARAGVLCRVNQACSCKNCDNPLNILHQYELDVLLARVDECLMQNLYSYEISGLCKLLVSEVVLPCCSTTSKLQHIIPGTMICNCCGNAVTYSWCTHSVHLQTICPRNHCMVCCACKPTLHTHCQNCQQCTASASQGSCMECGMIKLFAV